MSAARVSSQPLLALLSIEIAKPKAIAPLIEPAKVMILFSENFILKLSSFNTRLEKLKNVKNVKKMLKNVKKVKKVKKS